MKRKGTPNKKKALEHRNQTRIDLIGRDAHRKRVYGVHGLSLAEGCASGDDKNCLIHSLREALFEGTLVVNASVVRNALRQKFSAKGPAEVTPLNVLDLD